ncbi:hypothetical protein V8E54_014030 [Elaphomyces granulatus]
MPSGATSRAERTGPQAQRFIREARPEDRHGNLPAVPRLLQHQLDLDRPHRLLQRRGDEIPHVDWRSARISPFRRCRKGILGLAGFPEIEVAFRESEVTHSVGGPKLLHPQSSFRKAFTPTEGTGGGYGSPDTSNFVNRHMWSVHFTAHPLSSPPRVDGLAPAPSISASAKTTTVSSFSPLSPSSRALQQGGLTRGVILGGHFREGHSYN